MAVFRVERTGDYTVMSNNHLKNKRLSLKAKGLMSIMLSLPEDWDYTLQGLAQISLEKIDAVRKAIKELENEGYITRSRERDNEGKLRGTEYIIREQPISEKPTSDNPTLEKPMLEKPTLENPTLDKPTQAKPTLEKPMQLNKYILNKNILNTKSNQIYDAVDAEEIVKQNIDYDILCERVNKDQLDEIVGLIVEKVCTMSDTVHIAGGIYRTSFVRDRLLSLECQHIEYVFNCMDENTADIRNIKKYLLATLFNAPNTIDNYYKSQVNHDLYGKS